MYISILRRGKRAVLNLCSANDIILWKLMPQGEGQMACMSISDFKKLRPISRKRKSKSELQKNEDCPSFFKKAEKERHFSWNPVFLRSHLYAFSAHLEYSCGRQHHVQHTDGVEISGTGKYSARDSEEVCQLRRGGFHAPAGIPKHHVGIRPDRRNTAFS